MSKDPETRDKLIAKNQYFTSFGVFMRGQGGNTKNYSDEYYLYAKYHYGKAVIPTYALYDENGGLTDLVFDLRDVHKKYANDMSYYYFLEKVHNKIPYDAFMASEWMSVKDEKIAVIGIPVFDKDYGNYPPFCIWAPAIEYLLEALDLVTGQSNQNMSREFVIKSFNKGFKGALIISLFFGAIMLAGIVLIILGIAKVIPTWLGWVLGLIATLGGGFMFISGFFFGWVRGKKDFVEGNIDKDEETLIRARYSKFE